MRIGLACATIQRMDWDYVGNEWAVQMLKHQVANNSTRHAYIFAGPPGVGKRTLALRFIQSLNCPKAEGTGEPCLECRSCRQIEAKQFTDLQVVEMAEEKSLVAKEQIQQVLQFLSLSPYESKAKTVLFINFQKTSVAAQNTLLKTLEESPGSSRLIITTDTVESLLPTIASRCEIMNIRPLPASEVTTALIQRLGVDAELAGLLGHISGGRFGYASHLVQDPEILEKRSTWLDEWIEIQTMDSRQKFKFAEDKVKGKKELKRQRELLLDMLDCWTSYTRDVLMYGCQAGADPMNIDRKAELLTIAAKTTPDRVAELIRNLQKASERISRNNNLRLVMEVLMLEI